MTPDNTPGPIQPDSTVGLLRATCPQAWQVYTEHAFVDQQEVSRAAMRYIDRVAARRIGDAPTESPRWPYLRSIFTKATQLEAAFWQMGLHAGA